MKRFEIHNTIALLYNYLAFQGKSQNFINSNEILRNKANFAIIETAAIDLI